MLYGVALLSLTSLIQAQGWTSVEKIFGKPGTIQNDVFKITFPRSDLKVQIASVAVEPGLALTSWVAFKGMHDGAMIMGDLVLLEPEVGPVVKKLTAQEIEITAIHNHLLGESPSIKYLHFSGHGDAAKLASAMLDVLKSTATPLAPPATQSSAAIDWGNVESIIGLTGQHKGNLLQFGIPRKEAIVEGGMEIPPFMGMATAINLQRVGENAATTGDFVLIADEVNPVIRALTEHGITVTALHNHMLNESPRLFFMHFWGFDKPETLARGLRAALDKTNSTMKR